MPPDAATVARRAIALKHLATFAIAVPPRDLLARLKQTWSATELAEFLAQSRADQQARRKALGPWIRCLTRRERAVFDCTADTLSQRDQINASWRIECVYVLAWALRARERLPPYERQVSTRGMADFPPSDLDRFVAKARLRPRAEIEAARDLAEFWHWRSRTRELHEGKEPLRPDADMCARGIQTYDDIARHAVRNARRRGELRSTVDDDFKVRGKAYRDLSDDEWSEVRSITVERHYALNWLCGLAPRNSWERTTTDT
jgi:hypothetical protein